MLIEKFPQRGDSVCTRFDKNTGHDGYARPCQFRQIVFIHIPTHYRLGIEEPRLRGGAIQPLQKFRQAGGVIPGGAQQREFEPRPIHAVIIPIDDLGCLTALGKRGQQWWQIFI